MGENCGCRKATENTSAQLKGGVAQAICSSQFIVLFGKFSMGSAAFIYLKFTHFTVIFYYQNHLGCASSLCMSFSPSFKCLTTKPHKQLKILFSIFSQAIKSCKVPLLAFLFGRSVDLFGIPMGNETIFHKLSMTIFLLSLL